MGKPITQVNIDEGTKQLLAYPSCWLDTNSRVIDLSENDKPWRKPGTDISDYFNYGFDEFTWAMYAAKQENMRAEFSQDAIAQNNKKIMEEMQMMMMGGMPGMGGGGGDGSMPNLPGMDPNMQAMMQQMMASGMDPSQMDPAAMSSMFAGMQNAGGNTGGQGGQNQNFGGAGQAFGGGNNQGQGFGFDQGMGRGGGGGGNFGGRGRGGRRNW